MIVRKRKQIYKVRSKRTRPLLSGFYFIRLGKALVLLLCIAILAYALPTAEEIDSFFSDLKDDNRLFPLDDIQITGLDKVTLEEVHDILKIYTDQNMLFINLEELRGKVKTIPRIRDVKVQRILPSTLKLDIIEDSPEAVFIDDKKKAFLMSRTGKILEEASLEDLQQYLNVSGKNSPVQFPQFADILIGFPNITKELSKIDLANGRRWNLYLKAGGQIKLPENNYEQALDLISKKFTQILQLDSRYAVDFRLFPDKIFITSLS